MTSREVEWAAWMRAAMAGDADAYRRLLTSITPHLRSVARSRSRGFGQESEVEDIVQDVLLTIHLKRGSWDQTRPIGPWVAAIMRNKLVDALRRRGRQVNVPIEDVMDQLRSEDQEPELAARDLDVMLGGLKAQQRSIVQAISLDGESAKDVAARLQMTEVAVRVTLHRALKSLAAVYRSPNQ